MPESRSPNITPQNSSDVRLLPNRSVVGAWFVLLLATPALAAERSFPSEDVAFFERKVRPVLVERCLKCHGAKKQDSGLRLDSRAAVLQGGDSGPAARVGAPGSSLLIEAVRGSGELKMPPDEALKPAEVDVLVKWVQLGLPWPKEVPSSGGGVAAADAHWAFQAVVRPDVPSVVNADWAKSDVDRFVLAGLAQAGLSPAAEASARALIRRATFDLTGLPPSVEEVARFEAEYPGDSDGAYRKLIDRLLDSPHYGERQGRHWLDVARYADNKGYVFFEEKEFPWAWTYRDWVIRSFNEDLPYDQFVTQQLAADLLNTGDRKTENAENDEDGRRSLAAMGFLTLGARFMNNTHDIIDDQIDVVTRGLMGLTVTCARCHDHKFDPIPQADYYSLYGIFRSSHEPTLRPLFQATPDTEEYRAFETGMVERVAALRKFEDGQRALIMKGARERAADYLLAVHRKRNQPSTENFMLLADKGGLIPAVIHRWEGYLKLARRNNDPVWTLWHQLFDLPEEGFEAAADSLVEAMASADDAPNEKSASSAATLSVNRLVLSAFSESPPKSMQDVAQHYGVLFKAVDQQWAEALKQVDSQPPPAPLSDGAAEALRQVLYGVGSPPMIPKQLGWGFLDLIPDRPTQGEFKKLIGEVEKWSRTGPGAPPRAMVLVDSEVPYQPVIFQRGNPNREGRAVPRRIPEILSRSERLKFTRGSGRLELARAIVDPANPLTARVFVNRIWQQHFGTGIVDTPSDFGLRSSAPTHPKLLDWLASEFVDGGWSVKKLHRLIMNSAVYRQAAEPTQESIAQAMQVDAANRLLWKFARRRLDFEATRDSLLAVSGTLDRKLGGAASNVLNGFVPRRTVYGFVNRMDLPGLMRAFDFPEPAATSPGRETTTIAPQALYFLNNDFVTECARRLLTRQDVASLSGPRLVPDRIHKIYRILFSRDATADEISVAMSFLERPKGGNSAASETWSYGYGGINEKSGRVVGFGQLAHWTGSRWQAGAKLPDAKLGWVFHEKNGGHPASSDDRCAIRRWTSPVSGRIEIKSRIKHLLEPGNGVRGRIVSSEKGILAEAKVDHSEAELNVTSIVVEPGDTIDFVADWQGHITHDEHEWLITIQLVDSGGKSDDTTDQSWDAQRDFVGGGTDAWTDYVHALMMTNEFVFPD
ncbi:MAG: PSD1 and planctomycete cytochrome C domain-containing protein [Planctomycetales bacterium]